MNDGLPLPPLRLKKNEDRRLKAEHLWVFSNEVDTAATPLMDFEPGAAVELQSSNGKAVGTGTENITVYISMCYRGARCLYLQHRA